MTFELFSLIVSAMLALKQLGIEVEAYYSSEVDCDAIIVTQYHHPEVIELGDIRNLTHDKVKMKPQFLSFIPLEVFFQFFQMYLNENTLDSFLFKYNTFSFALRHYKICV